MPTAHAGARLSQHPGKPFRVKVIVLGSGVVGVSSAWYLAQAGHDVTVIDRQPEAGMETSFANAGQVSPGLSAPWAGPDTPRKAIFWLLMRHRPLVVWPLPDPALMAWVSRFLGNCNDAAYARNKERMVRLAEYSRDRLRDLRVLTGLAYDDRQRGLLQLFRKQAQLDGIGCDTAVLDRLGVPYRLLDRQGCVAQEPALGAVTGKFRGGLLLTGDETGDAHLFTQRLAALAEKAGVVFRHNVAIERLDMEGGRIAGVVTSAGLFKADSYVVALGSYSPRLLKQIGIGLPVYPVKGYSLTIDVVDEARAPQSTVMDETFKVGITRLGSRIRVGGTAELAGYSSHLREPRRRTLEHSVTDLFPGAGDVKTAKFWTGLRPMTPDGPPVIGPTKFDNLWLNTGHGTLGWTMSCGSGALLADLMSGRRPNVEHEDLAISRYGARAA
jgi:D-amino-acid dehydrogenase